MHFPRFSIPICHQAPSLQPHALASPLIHSPHGSLPTTSCHQAAWTTQPFDMGTAFITCTISAVRHPLITARVSARVFTLANKATLIVAMLYQSRSARFRSPRAFEPNSQHYTHKALASLLKMIAIHNVARHQFSTPHISTLYQLLLMFSLHFLWTFCTLNLNPSFPLNNTNLSGPFVLHRERWCSRLWPEGSTRAIQKQRKKQTKTERCKSSRIHRIVFVRIVASELSFKSLWPLQ